MTTTFCTKDRRSNLPAGYFYIIRGIKITPEDEVEDKFLLTRAELRLLYIKSLQSHIPKSCPHCRCELVVDEEQIYCPSCGLVTQDSYNYQAGMHFTYPHGLKLM